MNAADIRDLYREFFVARGHLAGEPASLVPAGDTSVLFTTAGMQQYKPYFLGVETPPATRITTCQRSFRTSDIENVGKTPRHLTFFEMLGNFSFGDYFKAEAIAWSLELSDELGIERDKIWVSVFGGDDQVPADEEAVALWKSHGFAEERIVRLGRGDNFWGPAGPTGPCGPCSELYYDFGPEMGCDDPDCKPGCDCDRFLEYWNLVFVQYDMDEAGNLTQLPKGSIDTGMGLERIAAITQGLTNVFDCDVFAPLVAQGRGAGRREACGLAGRQPRPAHHGRARPRRRLPHHGRRAARQRRPRLRAAPHHPPRRATGRGHRPGRAVPREAGRRGDRADGRRVPAAGRRAARDRARHPGRGSALPPHPAPGHGHPGRGAASRPGRRHRAARGGRVRASRHLRLPLRPHARDGGGVGHERGRGALRAPHGGAARARPRRPEGGRLQRRPRRAGGVPAPARRPAGVVRGLRAPRGVHGRAGPRRAGRRPSGRQARRVAVLRRGRRSGGRHRLDPHRVRQAGGRRGRPLRERPGRRRAPRGGQGRGRRARQGHGQRGAAARDGLQPHGHAPAAQRPAHRARRARPAGRLAGPSRALPLRLLRAAGARPPRSCARSRTWSTAASSRTTRCARS